MMYCGVLGSQLQCGSRRTPPTALAVAARVTHERRLDFTCLEDSCGSTWQLDRRPAPPAPLEVDDMMQLTPGTPRHY